MRLGAIFLFLGLVAATPAMAGESLWSGYYIGADVGGDLAKFSRQEAVISPFGSEGIPVPSAALDGTSNGDASPAITLRLGRSFMANDWLLFGLEIEGSYQRASATFSASHTFQGSTGSAPGSVSYLSSDTASSEATFDWTAALRARLGYLVAPNLLFYAAAGPTIASVGFSAAHAGNGVLSVFEGCPPNLRCSVLSFPTGGLTAASESRTVAGINLAGGVEYQLTANISLRAEYDYSQFSSIRLAAPPYARFIADEQSTSDRFKVTPVLQTARLGMAYHF